MNEYDIASYTWRTYQRRLKRRSRHLYYLRRMPLLCLFGLVGFLILASVFWAMDRYGVATGLPFVLERQRPLQRPSPLYRKDLAAFLGGAYIPALQSHTPYRIVRNGNPFTLETAIDASLQEYTHRLLGRSRTHQAAVVVLRPKTGQVLVMAQYPEEAGGDAEHLCLKSDYPAASLFKIVAAAAAIERKDFGPDTQLTYNGSKYTLYKRQLTDKVNRYTAKVTLEKAFSKSINPVFGKMGIHDLGKDLLSEYAGRFLFNRPIPFDVPPGVSVAEVPENAFGLAEIASGFNKRTLVSPLHVALITSAVVSGGSVMEPWVIKRIRDASDKIVYQASLNPLARVIGEGTARALKTLMEETVKSGTCQRAFRPLRRKKAFEGFAFGAKTGTINDPTDRFKYDWLSAYALPGDGSGGICVAVLAMHGEKLGIRANELGREIINRYFSS